MQRKSLEPDSALSDGMGECLSALSLSFPICNGGTLSASGKLPWTVDEMRISLRGQRAPAPRCPMRGGACGPALPSVTVPLILSRPNPLPRGPVTSQGHPTLRSSMYSKRTGLGFHAHKMPEIKAELTTWKVEVSSGQGA